MKKFLIGMFAFVLCLGMNSCKKEAPAAGADAEKAATEKVEEAPSLADVVAKAKAEGANWSVDEWKAQFKAAIVAVKPALIKLKEIQDKIQTDPSEAEEIMKDAQYLEAKYEKIGNLMEELGSIAEQSENGKIVSDDDEFTNQILEELGLGDLDM